MRLGLDLSLIGPNAGVTPFGPTPLAVSDFANGVYTVGGSAVAVGDMWDGANLSDWDPDTDITAGVGQTSGSAELKAGVIDPQDAAFTVVSDWDLVADSFVDIIRVDWATINLQRFRAWGPTETLEVTDGTTSDSESVSAGRHRTAVTFSSGVLAASTDGGSPISIVPAGGPYTTLVTGPGVGSSIAKITFYPAQDEADLPALSAL